MEREEKVSLLEIVNRNQETNIDLTSNEEQDQLSRSTKKSKRKITHLIFNQQSSNDEIMTETELVEEGDPVMQEPGVASTHKPSFRDMVRHATQNQNSSILSQNVEDEDDVSDDDTAPEDILNDERCPAILLSKEEKKRMRKPWRNTLIIKMFDGNVGYMGLMRKLEKKWNLRGELALTDIGHKFFVARFSNEADYNFVLTQGPWMIDDNYLTIRKWVPNFVPDESPIKVLTAWVRIPNLSVEYFDANFLHKIGSKIGKVLRIDKTTAQAQRGQFSQG